MSNEYNYNDKEALRRAGQLAIAADQLMKCKNPKDIGKHIENLGNKLIAYDSYIMEEVTRRHRKPRK